MLGNYAMDRSKVAGYDSSKQEKGKKLVQGGPTLFKFKSAVAKNYRVVIGVTQSAPPTLFMQHFSLPTPPLFKRRASYNTRGGGGRRVVTCNTRGRLSDCRCTRHDNETLQATFRENPDSHQNERGPEAV